MAHTIANKEKLILRIKKIKGQLNSIEKALENESDCSSGRMRKCQCHVSWHKTTDHSSRL